MKCLIFSLVFGCVVASAGIKELAMWTQDSKSAQASIFQVLEIAAKDDTDSKEPHNSIIKNQQGWSVKTTKGSISCEIGKIQNNPIPSYRCVVKGNVTIWTNNSESVQAVLYEAMETFLDKDKESGSPKRLVRRKAGELVIQDSTTSLTCRAGSRGRLQAVQFYSCVIK